LKNTVKQNFLKCR